MPVNPYIAGNPVGGGDAFVGRADVLRDVARVLRSPNENALVLYGQRRIGKTSILQELIARLPEIGPYQPVYFDLQGKAVSSLREVLAELAIPWGISTEGDFLPEVLDHMPPGTSLVVLLDEYGLLDNRGEKTADESMFIYLRDLLNLDPQRLQFIFVSGQRPEDMPALALSIFKSIKSRPVSLLSRNETEELVRLAERNDSLNWPDETVEYVYSLTGGHPFLTQQLCQEVWEQAYYNDPAEPPTIHPKDVDAVIPIAMRSSANALEWVWAGLGPAERVVASALARMGPGEVTQSHFSRGLHQCGIRVMTSALQDAVHILNEWDMIGTTDYGYYFKVELLRRWIASRKTLVQLQEEVCRIDPVADNLYREAYQHYQQGELDQAVPLLHQAIGLNPNHIQANQLLAEILLAQGEIYKARQMLESLAEYLPAVQPRLVQALLLQAREATPDEQLSLYNRVLQLDPDHPEALAGRRRIWVQRGDESLAAGNALEAMSAYRRADLPEKIVTAGLIQVDRLEQAGKHLAALDLAEQLYAEFPSQRTGFPALLVAEILLSRQEFSKAIGKLRNLYADQPDEARSLLVKALLKQAQTISNEDERLALYEEILQIEPEQPQALEQRRRIMARRADEALQAGQIEQAFDAYQAAGLEQQATRLETQLRRHKLEEGLQQLASLEQAGEFQAALELAQQLAEAYPEYRDELPDLERLEQNAWLDKVYRRAIEALRKKDRQTAQSLLAQVIAVQPDYREATRYLHLLVTGVDVAELQTQMEKDRAALEQVRIEAQTEAFRRSQLEENLKQLQKELEAERVSRRETEAFAQKEAASLRQQEKELQKLQNRLEAEIAARRDAEARAETETDAHRAFEEEVNRLLRQIEIERDAREKAERLARQEAENRRQREREIERLRAVLEAEKKDAMQKAKFAAVRARRELRSEVSRLQTELNTRRRSRAVLSPWNPLHHLRLLWWLFMSPQRIRDYKQQFGARSLHRVGKWPATLLIWLPLIFPTLALGLETLPASPHAWLTETYLWLSGGLFVVFLLTGWLGDTDDIPVGLLLVVVSFLGAIGAANGVAVGLSTSVLNDWLIGLTIGVALLVAIGITFIVQGSALKLGTVVTIGVAIIVVVIAMAIRIGYVTSNITVDIAVSALGGLAGCLTSTLAVAMVVWVGERLVRMNNKWFIAVFGMLIIGAPGIVAGLVAGLVANDTLIGTAFGMAFSLANAVVIATLIILGTLLNEKGLLQHKNYSFWLARGSFGILLLVYLLIVWQLFLGGWRLVIPPQV